MATEPKFVGIYLPNEYHIWTQRTNKQLGSQLSDHVENKLSADPINLHWHWLGEDGKEYVVTAVYRHDHPTLANLRQSNTSTLTVPVCQFIKGCHLVSDCAVLCNSYPFPSDQGLEC